MNWKAVCSKLRAAADQHAKDAYNEIAAKGWEKGHEKAMCHSIVGDTCYALAAALEAGMIER